MGTQRKSPHQVMVSTRRFFDLWVEKPENIEQFFSEMELADGSARQAFVLACRALKIPYTLMFAYVHSQPELKQRYDSFLAAMADRLATEALEDVDGAVCKDTAAAAKVKADTKLRIAEKWDRERYGERITVDRNVNLTVDAALVGTAGDLLKSLAKRAPAVIENEVPALPEKVE